MRSLRDMGDPYQPAPEVSIVRTLALALARCKRARAGFTRFLSFDANARALASAEGMGGFPGLEPGERRLVARLKR